MTKCTCKSEKNKDPASAVAERLEHLTNLLTPREQEILHLFSQGLDTGAVAERLSLSKHTVRTHAKHLYRKLKVTDRVQAVLVYMGMEKKQHRRQPGR